MPTARRAGQDLIAVLATAGDHAGDLTDGHHAPNADSVRKTISWPKRTAVHRSPSSAC